MKPHEERGLTKEEMADLNPAKLRKIERLSILQGKWEECRMKDLHPGERFRYTDDPERTFAALEDPYVNDFYIWSINAQFVSETQITEQE
jgi:hypothetical protein